MNEDINCKQCGKKLGEKNPTDIFPLQGVNVSIEGGFIFFQCPFDNSYTNVAQNKFDFTLHKPGTPIDKGSRIY
jgi:hypothetical protein